MLPLEDPGRVPIPETLASTVFFSFLQEHKLIFFPRWNKPYCLPAGDSPPPYYVMSWTTHSVSGGFQGGEEQKRLVMPDALEGWSAMQVRGEPHIRNTQGSATGAKNRWNLPSLFSLPAIFYIYYIWRRTPLSSSSSRGNCYQLGVPERFLECVWGLRRFEP